LAAQSAPPQSQSQEKPKPASEQVKPAPAQSKAAPAQPAASPAAADSPAPPKKAKKVWTTDDVAGMAGGSPAPSPRQKEEASSNADREEGKGEAQSKKAPPPQHQDPEYYKARLTPLRDELRDVESKLSKLQSTPTDYRTGSRTESVAGLPTHSFTVQNEIERLERRRETLKKRIAEIETEARSNGVSIYY
jgi:chaperonin cofactor prefoldin